MTASLAAGVAATSLGTALLALAAMARLLPVRRVSWASFDTIGDRIAFLFAEDRIVDATPEARALLRQGPEHLPDWPRLAVVLGSRFPDLLDRIADLRAQTRIDLRARTGDAELVAEWRDGLTRVTIETGTETGAATGAATGRAAQGQRGRAPRATAHPAPASLARRTMAEEVSELRGLLDGAPVLIWREDAAGAVRWANTAYVERALQRDADSETLTWPLPALFEDLPRDIAERGDAGGDPPRVALSLPAAAPGLPPTELCFEVHARATATGRILYALPADRLRRTEGQLREFVQTLTKTFAHLPIGLAVFDRDRRLVVFNPALTDLTGLDPLFLSRRPTLFEFLDQLREAQRMPEPKDYRDWRQRIGALEAAATTGPHIETWTLPDGQTFRVTGRPHPEGAVAFLFQDITSEMSLTRRFRSELELGQSVIDSMDEAVAVFSASQALVMTNRAYDALWGAEAGGRAGAEEDWTGDAGLAILSLGQAAARWQRACQPTPLWHDLRALADRQAGGAPCSGTARLTDGRALAVRAAPLSRGATLVGFRLQPAAAPDLDSVLGGGRAAAAPGPAAAAVAAESRQVRV